MTDSVIESRLNDIAESSWEAIFESMAEVVHGVHGTARTIGTGLNYRMAGKTGTAQVFGIPQGEEYDASELSKRLHDHALFIAFAPVDNPQLVVALIVENGGSGSKVAAPIARQIFDYFLGNRG